MASRRPPDYRTLASLSRVKLLNALFENGALTVEELAETTGLHPNTTREHLHRLIDSGLVSSRTQRGATAGRPKLTYTVEVDRNDPVQSNRVHTATAQAEYLRRLLPSTTVQHPLTTMSRQVDVLEYHIDECGFEATVEADSARVIVHVCPFEQLARQHPLVCQVHFRLMDRALHSVDGPLEADALHSLDPVDGCSIDLRMRAVDAPPRPNLIAQQCDDHAHSQALANTGV